MNDPARDNPEVRHETSDVSVRGILYTAAALAGIAVVIHLGSWWLLEYLHARERRAKPDEFPLAAEERRPAPPRPDLPTPPGWNTVQTLPQPPPAPQLEGVLRMEGKSPYLRPESREAAPDDYRWVDRKAGVVQIPLERAMDLVREQEKSAGKGGQAGPAPPSRANSGRGPDGREP